MSTIKVNKEISNQFGEILDFIKIMQDSDPHFKDALGKILNGEDNKIVAADSLCNGNMSEIINAIVSDKTENGGLEEEMNDIKFKNDLNNSITNGVNELKMTETSEKQ